uniref:Uncharacterized protein n=1 Tax=Trichogramma kaykai TaxID=54128 RepID=A0ABD2WWT5_9HYME
MDFHEITYNSSSCRRNASTLLTSLVVALLHCITMEYVCMNVTMPYSEKVKGPANQPAQQRWQWQKHRENPASPSRKASSFIFIVIELENSSRAVYTRACYREIQSTVPTTPPPPPLHILCSWTHWPISWLRASQLICFPRERVDIIQGKRRQPLSASRVCGYVIFFHLALPKVRCLQISKFNKLHSLPQKICAILDKHNPLGSTPKRLDYLSKENSSCANASAVSIRLERSSALPKYRLRTNIQVFSVVPEQMKKTETNKNRTIRTRARTYYYVHRFREKKKALARYRERRREHEALEKIPRLSSAFISDCTISHSTSLVLIVLRALTSRASSSALYHALACDLPNGPYKTCLYELFMYIRFVLMMMHPLRIHTHKYLTGSK